MEILKYIQTYWAKLIDLKNCVASVISRIWGFKVCLPDLLLSLMSFTFILICISLSELLFLSRALVGHTDWAPPCLMAYNRAFILGRWLDRSENFRLLLLCYHWRENSCKNLKKVAWFFSYLVRIFLPCTYFPFSALLPKANRSFLITFFSFFYCWSL